MLSICSDLDETPTADDYFTISQYLNTTQSTPIGRGVGLEVGNTLFFDMAPGEFSYWSATDAERARTRTLIHSGHIDCFHSYGDLATKRADAVRALEELARYECKLPVWVDHGLAISNLGPDIMVGQGDVQDHPVYHADLTLDHGVRYAWLGRVTSCIGQNAPYSLTTGLKADRSIATLKNTVKDAIKLCRGMLGDPKYDLHRGNRLTRRYTLRNGGEITEFMRCNPHPRGVSVGDHAGGIGHALNAQAIEHLVERRGVSIVYTHLGKGLQRPALFNQAAREGFQRLADAQARGDLLIATTSRVLDFVAARDALTVEEHSDHVALHLPAHLPKDGLAWRGVDDRKPVTLNGRSVRCDHSTDERGSTWSCFAWPRLEYPSEK